MTITLIGSGNAATVLGHRFKDAGHTIKQVLSPNNAAVLAQELDAEAIKTPAQLTEADFYLIAVTDRTVEALGATLHLKDALVAHTAGSLPLRTLHKVSTRYGVFYPLQSLRKGVNPKEIPLLIDGADEQTATTLTNLAHTISTTVTRTTDQDRLFFHVGAVVVNNFPNYLYTLTELYLRDKGLDWRILLPLLTETIARLYTEDPAQMQTGPAVRDDGVTIEKHTRLLQGYPELQAWYERFSSEIRHSLAISRH